MADQYALMDWDGDLTPNRYDAFLDRASTALLEAELGLEIDLRISVPVPSTLLGVLSQLGIEAHEQNKLLRVLVPTGRAETMRAVGLDRFVEIIEPDKPKT